MKKKGNDDAFEMIRHSWCIECAEVTLHTMVLESGNELTVSYRKFCNKCIEKKIIAEKLALEEVKVFWKHCTIPTSTWNFLVLNPNVYDP